MTPLQRHAQDYLTLRQALGHKMAHAARELPRFVAYWEDQHIPTITVVAALAWAQATPCQPAPGAQLQRLSIVRGFARFMVGVNPATQIPPAGLLVYRPERRTPFIYSRHDIRLLMSTIRQICPIPLRALAYSTLIGLLAVTGLRIGEALRLTDSDIDGNQGLLTIRSTKFGKSREVALNPSTVAALVTYIHARVTPAPTRETPYLFVTERGNPLTYARVGEMFRQAIRVSGVGAMAPNLPHLHDLRHAFAIRTLIAWHRQGVDVEAWLPRLSTYLGHNTPRETYVYLTAVPELLEVAAQKVVSWYEGETP